MIICTIPLPQKYMDWIKTETGEDAAAFSCAAEASRAFPDAEIVITESSFNEEDIGLFPRLKWIFVCSAGVDRMPFRVIEQKKILLSNVSGIHGAQIAEHTLGMMIMFSRRMLVFQRNQRERIWDREVGCGELAGRTLCIVGTGSIGREIARKAKAFDMRVIGLKKHLSGPLENFDEIMGMDRLEDALKTADYTVLIVPLTDETFHLFGEKEFAAMKKESYFLNMSRGDTVDEKAMIRALEEKKIAGAGLDVFHSEPLGEESPLWQMQNVIITPHVAGLAPGYFKKAFSVFRKEYRRFRCGEPLQKAVDLRLQY